MQNKKLNYMLNDNNFWFAYPLKNLFDMPISIIYEFAFNPDSNYDMQVRIKNCMWFRDYEGTCHS